MVAIPIAALHGDNVVERPTRMPWWSGPTLLDHLEPLEIAADRNLDDRRFPVQWVIRPMSDEHHDYRGYAGQVAGGVWRAGDDVLALPSGRTHPRRGGRDRATARSTRPCPGCRSTIRLEDDLDVPRGTCSPIRTTEPPRRARARGDGVLDERARRSPPARRFGVKHTTRTVARGRGLDRRRRRHGLARGAPGATRCALNDIGTVRLRLSGPLLVDPYAANRDTGAFILLDEATNDTVAAGMVLLGRAVARLRFVGVTVGAPTGCIRELVDFYGR